MSSGSASGSGRGKANSVEISPEPSAVGVTAVPVPESDGDWICPEPECANMNFARRSSCNRCGKDKPVDNNKKKCVGIEIGKMAAEKSRGLFSADDWQCSKCGNVNWARRSSCNVCNAPKFKEVEERTGYGGGYNDRGTVEYIEREESDDEFDEFGRKKKQFRKIKSGESQSDYDREKANAEREYKNNGSSKGQEQDESDEEVDEEEDEEDDEDGDLSKYDLSEWGIEKDEKTDNGETKADSEISEEKPSNDKEGNGDQSLTHSDESPKSSLQTRSRLETKAKSRSRSRSNSASKSRQSRKSRSRSRSRGRHKRSRSRSRDRRRHRSRSRERRRSRDRKSRSRSRSRSRGKDKKHRSRSRSRDRKRR